SLTDNEFQQFLRRTADDLGVPGRDDTYGWGVPNAGRLLQHLLPTRGFLRGTARAQSWQSLGNDDVVLSENDIAYDGCALDGSYTAARWEVRTHVSLPPGAFLETPEIIVRTHGSNGWTFGPRLEYNEGWGELIPGSVTA